MQRLSRVHKWTKAGRELSEHHTRCHALFYFDRIGKTLINIRAITAGGHSNALVLLHRQVRGLLGQLLEVAAAEAAPAAAAARDVSD